jgi:hypothetical protein
MYAADPAVDILQQHTALALLTLIGYRCNQSTAAATAALYL